MVSLSKRAAAHGRAAVTRRASLRGFEQYVDLPLLQLAEADALGLLRQTSERVCVAGGMHSMHVTPV